MVFLNPPQHGGDLFAASRQYGIAQSDWLDLSTGINPRAYPVDTIDLARCRYLPSDTDALCRVAQEYFRAPLLPVVAAGSQVLIQWLPQLRGHLFRKTARVAVPSIGYAEHAFRWRWAGHELVQYDPRHTDSIDELLQRETIDVLVVINPHNPLATVIEPARLLQWQMELATRDGWLIVDEAFVDAMPQNSIVEYTDRAGLIALRSFGKFFGLPGMRCGFASCDKKIAAALRTAIGPWPLASTTNATAARAYRDRAWQEQMLVELGVIAAANAELLRQFFLDEPALLLAGALFNTLLLPMPRVRAIAEQLARAAILIRVIPIDEQLGLLRFGLIDPQRGEDWQRLRSVFAHKLAAI